MFFDNLDQWNQGPCCPAATSLHKHSRRQQDAEALNRQHIPSKLLEERPPLGGAAAEVTAPGRCFSSAAPSTFTRRTKILINKSTRRALTLNPTSSMEFIAVYSSSNQTVAVIVCSWDARRGQTSARAQMQPSKPIKSARRTWRICVLTK